MTRRRTSARATVLAAGFVLVAGGAPVRSEREGAPTGEVWRSPFAGTEFRAFEDAATGEKWIEDGAGRRFPSPAEAAAAEEEALPRIDRVLDGSLRAAAAERPDDLVDVIVRLARQPLAEASDAVRARRAGSLDAPLRRLRELAAAAAARRLADGSQGAAGTDERDHLTAAERDEAAELRALVRTALREARSEIVALARPAAETDQEGVVRRLERAGAVVVARTFVLSAVAARVRAGELPSIAADLPEVARISPAGRRRVTLDTAVGTIGAGSWWTAGYDGSSSTKVAILDTGVDATHPAFPNGAVSDAAVHLAAGRLQSYFADNASSTDDLHSHGTHCAGIAGSRDSTYTGVAPGASIMNGKCGYQDSSGYGSLEDADIMSAGDWAATYGADVMSCSFGGGGTTNASSDLSHFFDAAVADLGIAVAVAAGNDGPTSGSVGIPADAFNVVTVGNFNDAATTSRSDDSLTSSSSRGATSDGRRKPDLAAPGTNITSSNAFYEGSAADWVQKTGTSMACPATAGALTVLVDAAAAATPEGLRALLLTNVRNTSPAPTSPDNNWGWGGLDLTAAYTNRAAVTEQTFGSTGTRVLFLKPGSLASGKRVTLCWNRRVVSNTSSAPTTWSSLLDLDLSVYDEADGSSRGTSTSTVNSTEQVKLTSSSSSPVVKVRRASASFPSGLSSQPWAFAAETTGTVSIADPPNLACSFTTAPTVAGPASDVTVTVQVENSGGLAAQSPSVTLTLPSGYTLVSGANPRTISNVAANGTGSATWTVRTSPGPTAQKTFTAAATTTSYGEPFAGGSTPSTHTLDATPPSGTVSVEGGASHTGATTVAVQVSATDANSTVASMRFREAGGTWGAWTAYAASGSATVSGADGTKTVEAEFRDAVGNVSSAVSDTIVLDRVAPTGTVTVDGGASFTGVAAVTLALTSSDAAAGMSGGSSAMRFGNDGSNWSAWQTPAATAAWTLAPGADGTRTVHAQFRDAVGNVSAAATDTIALDTTGPAASLSIASGAPWTATAAVTLGVSATDAGAGPASMRFSDDGAAWSSWTAYAATAPWTLPGADGMKTVYVQVRDAVGNVSAAASDTIGLDRVAPGASLVIAGGAAWVSTAVVTLVPPDADVAEMSFSDDGVAWSAWQPYAATALWTLPGADGTKVVYARFRDEAGNTSDVASDDVGLDRAAPAASILLDAGAVWATSASVTVSATVSDATSGVQSARYSDDGAVWTTWTAYSATAARTLPGADGPKTVYAQFRDAAGNVSAVVTDGIGLDRAAPACSVVVAGGAAWVTSSSVALALSSSDATAGVSEMRFSDDGTTWSSWTPWSSTAARTLAPGDGTRTVHVQVRDAAGNVSAAGSDAVGVDTTAPSVSLRAAGGAAWTNTASVALAVTASDATSGLSQMRVRDDATPWTAWIPYAASPAWTLGGADGAHTVDVEVRDAAGNVTRASDGVGIDRAAPSGTVAVAGGAAATREDVVSLDLAWTDATAGVDSVRISDDGATWSAWTAAAPSILWNLPRTEGTRTVRVVFRDAAGNESPAAADAILQDHAAPGGTVVLAGGADYLPPGAPLTATLSASDPAGGSGVAEVAWSHDDGATWSEWTPLPAGDADVGLPAGRGDAPHRVTVRYRDAAGNVSGGAADAIRLLPSVPQDVSLVASVRGRVASAGDLDAYRIDLVAGDRLDALVAVTPAVRRAAVDVGMDVYGPGGERLVTGRHPAASARPGVRGLVAPDTGPYVVVLRITGPGAWTETTGGGGTGAAYSLTTRVRAARLPPPAGATSDEVVEIGFTGGSGRRVAGGVRGAVAAAAVLAGPDGERAVALRGRGTRWTLPAAALDLGAGGYTLRLTRAAAGPVSWRLAFSASRRAARGAETE